MADVASDLELQLNSDRDAALYHYARLGRLEKVDLNRSMLRNASYPISGGLAANAIPDLSSPVTLVTEILITGSNPAGAVFQYGNADIAIGVCFDSNTLYGAAGGVTDGATASVAGIADGMRFQVAVSANPGAGVLGLYVDGRKIKAVNGAAFESTQFSNGLEGYLNELVTNLHPRLPNGTAPSDFAIVGPLMAYFKQMPKGLVS